VQSQPKVTNGAEGAGEQIGVVLIEEDPDEEAGSQKDNVTVTKTTKRLERQGQDLTQVGADDLKTGRRARAWYTGPVPESYPRQTTAKTVIVERR
jgi:hypothetical protein